MPIFKKNFEKTTPTYIKRETEIKIEIEARHDDMHL